MPCVSLQRKRVEFQKSSSEIQQLLLKLGFICDNDDPIGNITQIDDNAQQTIYFNGSVVSPSQKFEYDALYRLLKSTGREHVSINASSEPEAEGYNPAQISPQDGSAMRNYVREWQYDSVGNILSLIHNANGNAWTRSYDYASDSNRVNSTTVGQTTVNYTYNAHGSMISMPHLQGMQWDFAERLSHITRGTIEAYYNYDSSGQRVRKVVEKSGIVETRLYLGGFEIWRKSVNGVLETERETLHVMDDQKRVAIVETLTIDNAVAVANPVPVQRYQLDNHLGSASLELDETANVVSYEEYYPYGDTSYQAGRSASEVSQKRYRYTGKEKDEESGLYYHGARYYACWLGRWTAADPIGLVDGVNLYAYVRGNPVRLSDPSGTTTEEKVDEGKVFPTFEEVETKGEGGANEKNGSVNEIKNQIEDESNSFHFKEQTGKKSLGIVVFARGWSEFSGYKNRSDDPNLEKSIQMNRRLDSLWFKTSRKYGEKLEKQGFSVYYYDYLTTSEFSAIGKMNNVVGLYLYAHGDKSADEKITGFYTASYKHQNAYYDDILDKEIPGLGHFITPQTKMSNFNPVQIAFLQMCYNQNIWNNKIGKFEYTGGVLPSGEINTFYTVSMGIYEFYRKIMETYYE